MGGIYKIEHISGKYYIGMSVDIFGRWGSHYSSIRKGGHSSPLFQDLFLSSQPHHWTFSILEYVSISEFKKSFEGTKKQCDAEFKKWLLQREKYWMGLHRKADALNANVRYFAEL